MHTLDQDLRRLVEEGVDRASTSRAMFAVDPQYLDGVHVRPRDLDAEAWSIARRRAHHDPGGSDMAIVQEYTYRAVDARGRRASSRARWRRRANRP